MFNTKLIIIVTIFAFSFVFAIENAFPQLSNNISNNQNANNSSFVPITNTSIQLNQSSENYSKLENLTNNINNQSIIDKNDIYLSETFNKYGKDGLAISDLYNSTLNSVVEVVTNVVDNYSLTKKGTGFVIDYNGNFSIVTSSSLVSDNNTVGITMSNGNSYESNLVAADPISNLAILSTKSIPVDMLIPLNLTNSTNLKVGQPVAAIGSTMDFSHLFNIGIISGLDQSISSFDQNASNSKIPTGIVTNLNLDTGFAGGPLLDINGNVIGMNLQNYTSDSSKDSGYSYAVSSNSINNIVPSLLTKGYYLHPWLGISGTNISPDIAKALNLSETRGFLVIATTDQSPADRAGILGGDNTTTINGRPITLGGDIILKVDNKDIQDIHDILTYIENEKDVGDNIIITVLRNGLLQSINVLLQPDPNQRPLAG